MRHHGLISPNPGPPGFPPGPSRTKGPARLSEGTPAQMTEEWLEETRSQLMKELRDLARIIRYSSRNVDEYRIQTLANDTEGTVKLVPDFERIDEIITSIVVTGPFGPAISSSPSNTNTVATPAAASLIASVTPGAIGLYTVEWTVEVQGAAATLANNYKLVSPLGTTLETADQPIAVGTYPQQPVLVYVSSVTQAVSIQTIATETTATITGTVTLVPFDGNVPFNLQLGKRDWSLQLPATGILVVAPVRMKLAYDDPRILTANVTGANWALELMGYPDDPGRRY